MKKFVLWSVLAALATVCAMPQLAQAELKPGDDAPTFNLPGSDGKTYKSEDFKGKQVVVIAWYPKAFTGGCTAECKSFRANGEALRKYNVAYFTASCDDAETNKKFAESLSLDYPILSDPSRKVSDAMGVTDANRKNPQRWTIYIGKDGKILHVDRSVKTGSHGTDVAAKLEELKVDKK